jgi:alkanesulfonate monooxygenase SsuD/methylene tetrahydromethanopterin reductase-like flavin-dependent oxidoreductase (luciferase family)
MKTGTSAITTRIRWGVKSFDNPDKARLYTNVQTVINGFREEKTGERGVPPSVAREDVVMVYLVAQPPMSMELVARHFDVSEDRIREYIRALRNRAKEEGSEQAED